VCGAGSGGWETIDFDEIELGCRWWDLVKQTNSRIYSKLAFVLSPRPGLHVHYRCPVVEGGHALARGYRSDTDTQENKLKVLVETRGEGNYIVVPPSPGQCHPSGQPYELLPGRDLAEVQTITAEQRQLLIETAEGLNEYVRPPRPRPLVRPPSSPKSYGGGRPGDDFDASASWAEVLEPHGWQFVEKADDGTQYWCRPGKGDNTVSASVNFEGCDLLYVFSTNASPFEKERGYNKFSAYALLNHGGDFTSASQALRRMGYGRPIPLSIVDPYHCYSQFVPRRRGSDK